MKLDRFAPIFVLGLCSGPEGAPLIAPDSSLQQALKKIHREASGPHCAFTAIALEEARFIQTPEGIRIQMGSRVFTVLRWSGAERVILKSIPTRERPDVKCLEVDGVPENDVGWYDCKGV
jgi:hypothetical protein